ncbi:MAG: M48 family metallopeptidase [Candidatus Pacebacteria bacterium]|nr:M48 family metallopeptidase [Candidatus Paceibacterota bacterium]
MATGYTQAEKNIRKTWILMGGFLIFIIFLGWLFAQYTQNPIILYFAVGFALISNFFSYFFADKVVLSVTGAKKADPHVSDDLKIIRIVENLAITAGLPTPKIYIIKDDAINAFATGRNPKNASVAFTRGLLKNLEKKETEGVAAHEISHIKNRDIMVMTIVVTLVGVVAIFSDLFIRMSFYGNSDNKKGNGIILIIGIVLAILSPVIAKIIQLAVSRKREYLADASGALLTRYPEGLASALEKISKQGKSMKKKSTATAHLFISNPLKGDGKKGNFFAKMFSTHPPIEERISLLRNMDGNNIA